MSKKSKVTLRDEIVRERRKKMDAPFRTRMHFSANRINTLMDSLRMEISTFLALKYGGHPIGLEDELNGLLNELRATGYQEFEA